MTNWDLPWLVLFWRDLVLPRDSWVEKVSINLKYLLVQVLLLSRWCRFQNSICHHLPWRASERRKEPPQKEEEEEEEEKRQRKRREREEEREIHPFEKIWVCLIFKLLLWVCVCLFVCLLACLFLSLSSSSSRISSTQSLSHTSRKTHLSCLLYFAPNPVLT